MTNTDRSVEEMKYNVPYYPMCANCKYFPVKEIEHKGICKNHLQGLLIRKVL